MDRTGQYCTMAKELVSEKVEGSSTSFTEVLKQGREQTIRLCGCPRSENTVLANCLAECPSFQEAAWHMYADTWPDSQELPPNPSVYVFERWAASYAMDANNESLQNTSANVGDTVDFAKKCCDSNPFSNPLTLDELKSCS